MPSTDWAVCFQPAPRAKVRLICFPHAGGGAAAFFPWAAHLGPEVEVWAVRAPGRETRLAEQPERTFAGLLAATGTGLASALEPPYALFGQSLGGLLAFEVARMRPRTGATAPRALIVAGTRAPDCPRAEPPIGGLPDDAFVAAMATRYQGIPPAILAHRELLELCLPALRADMQAIESYRFVEYAPLACPLVVLGGEQDALVTPAELAAWSRHTTAPCRVHRLPGGHFFLNDTLPVVAGIVRDAVGPPPAFGTPAAPRYF